MEEFLAFKHIFYLQFWVYIFLLGRRHWILFKTVFNGILKILVKCSPWAVFSCEKDLLNTFLPCNQLFISSPGSIFSTWVILGHFGAFSACSSVICIKFFESLQLPSSVVSLVISLPETLTESNSEVFEILPWIRSFEYAFKKRFL